MWAASFFISAIRISLFFLASFLRELLRDRLGLSITKSDSYGRMIFAVEEPPIGRGLTRIDAWVLLKLSIFGIYFLV
jgi:hypothetical protein